MKQSQTKGWLRQATNIHYYLKKQKLFCKSFEQFPSLALIRRKSRNLYHSPLKALYIVLLTLFRSLVKGKCRLRPTRPLFRTFCTLLGFSSSAWELSTTFHNILLWHLPTSLRESSDLLSHQMYCRLRLAERLHRRYLKGMCLNIQHLSLYLENIRPGVFMRVLFSPCGLLFYTARQWYILGLEYRARNVTGSNPGADKVKTCGCDLEQGN